MIEQTGNANGLTGAYQKLGKAQKDAYDLGDPLETR